MLPHQPMPTLSREKGEAKTRVQLRNIGLPQQVSGREIRNYSVFWEMQLQHTNDERLVCNGDAFAF